ncbi:hypothetical protein AOC36_11625 [Erysipelothrix larvae]|uniref:SAM-dependent MTase RsmB/NOP-type domain-containing protein n=1 Tax=Erysipelothrix larvae TaxID=1514105 RepID=A0A0X8H1Z9_9FIRM|nr:hypothetical protein [Erysipelothrix larvae]AMC94598.1 hypothetical protein AOC36_11625 [Erysipelothrix larvae]
MELHAEFIKMIYKEFDDETATMILKAYDKHDPVRGIKLNTNKPINLPFSYKPSLLNEEILIPDDYKIAVVHPFHHAGCYYIQDPSATLPVKALNPKPHDLVLDMCSAPGGKTTQILNAVNEGFLISNEVDYNRALKLVGNVERWGVENCCVVNHDGRSLPKYFSNTFDKIVLDVPCSGEGLYRKQPKHALNFNMKTIFELAQLQGELLEAAYQCSVDGAHIVYSTCTLNPYENEEVVIRFLEKHPECVLIDHGLKQAQPGIRNLGNKGARFYPSEDGEGHFVAKIRVKKETKRNTLTFKKYKSSTIEINKMKFTGHIIKHNDKIKCLKDRGPLDTDAHVIHDGTMIAIEKKGRYEFTQSCVYVPYLTQDIPKIAVDLNQAYQYLYGLSVDNPKTGYYLVTYQNQCLGFIKGQNNKYPKGLRNRFERY